MQEILGARGTQQVLSWSFEGWIHGEYGTIAGGKHSWLCVD